MVSVVGEVETLTEQGIWTTQEHSVWRAERFDGTPSFYPVFQSGDLYSYSPFLLALARGHVQLNHAFVERFTGQGLFTPIDLYLDAEISRIGGPPQLSNEINSHDDFIRKLTSALQADVDRIEAANPGKKNFVLCGGKDSLNTLLLRWSNGVVAVSAQPNFPLVRDFVERNGLDIEVVELEDRDHATMQHREVAEGFGRFDLAHFRWGVHLAQIAKDNDYQIVYWIGAMADALLTPYWQIYSDKKTKAHKRFRQFCQKCIQWNMFPVDRMLYDAFLVPQLSRTLWNRGAAWQGGCVAHERAITNCLTLSSYHGPETTKVLYAANFLRLTRSQDVRDAMGHALHGKPVHYPTKNPGPAGSKIRSNLWHLDKLMDSLDHYGLEVRR